MFFPAEKYCGGSTGRQKEILSLSEQGYRMMEIADTLSISVNTVKDHKRQLFDILNVDNIIDAITVATLYHLI
ncbi:MAG: helix-turn-helix transcriptional regulator [Tannerella sp.]|nr:helix-turn-helix transcriptional regulator [Tannerella sp.]